MRFVIGGAGQLGFFLATLLSDEHDIILIDHSPSEIEKIQHRYDFTIIRGECTEIETLKQAEIADADAYIALTGKESANIISCQLAAKLGCKKNICRLFKQACFSESDGITPDSFGLQGICSSHEETANKVLATLRHPILLDEFLFFNEKAMIDLIQIPEGSPIGGTCIKDIPDINHIRIAAILKNEQLSTKVRGDIVLSPGDRLYVCGQENYINDFLDFISPGKKAKSNHILITGNDEVCYTLIKRACDYKYKVSVICPDLQTAELMQDDLRRDAPNVNFFCGDTTDEFILKEAGISDCDAFINADTDDEQNILSCIVAKKLGAKKVTSLTHRPEYMRIFREIKLIDCAFCMTAISAYSIVRKLKTGSAKLDELFSELNANAVEFHVTKRSPLSGKMIKDAKFPSNVTLALLCRNDEIITPVGTTVLQDGDTVVIIGTADTLNSIKAFFPDAK